MTIRETIFCCGCQQEVEARLTNGAEIYPHRADLQRIHFWKCDTCKNAVGTHWKTKQPTKPLGVIPTPQIKKARQHIHALIDPIWHKQRIIQRSTLYAKISKALGYTFHTGEIRSIEEARKIYKVARDVINQIEADANEKALSRKQSQNLRVDEAAS
jgi:hypothetical protein